MSKCALCSNSSQHPSILYLPKTQTQRQSIHLSHIHKAQVIKRRCSCRWAGGGGGSARLFTASYDGSLSMLDPCAGRFERLISSDEAEFSSFDCSPDGHVAILGDNDGYLHVFDIREGQASMRSKPAEIHNKRVNTLHVSLLSPAIPPGHVPAVFGFIAVECAAHVAPTRITGCIPQGVNGGLDS